MVGSQPDRWGFPTSPSHPPTKVLMDCDPACFFFSQAGETSFVNYMDASKNYDSARDPLGCDIILVSPPPLGPLTNKIS